MNKIKTKGSYIWWLVTLKGIFFLTFGLIILTHHNINQIKTINFFSTLLGLLGILLIPGSVYCKKKCLKWKWLLAEGIFDFIISIVILFIVANHRLTAIAMFTEIIAIWALVYGLIQIISSFQYSLFSFNWVALALGGIVALTYTSIAFMTVLPGTDAKTSATGIFTLVSGIIMLLNSAGIFLKRR